MTAFKTSREIPATPDQVFSAFSSPERLARWWGPAGFRSTFNVYEFKEGGRWSFVMHGPEGASFPNESLFAEIVVPRRVVIHHLSQPEFRLTVSLDASATGTTVSWEQVFENAEVAARIRHIVEPANEQNLDRLAAEVSGRS